MVILETKKLARGKSAKEITESQAFLEPFVKEFSSKFIFMS